MQDATAPLSLGHSQALAMAVVLLAALILGRGLPPAELADWSGDAHVDAASPGAVPGQLTRARGTRPVIAPQARPRGGTDRPPRRGTRP